MRGARIGVLVVLIAFAFVTPWGALSADPCANPTVKGSVGTNGNDVIRGTNRNDVLTGLQGDDIICGLGGNDILEGDQGFDTLYGGGGDDRLIGSYDNDKLFGGRGNDMFLAGTNDTSETDYCNGGAGSRDRNPERDCDTSISIEIKR